MSDKTSVEVNFFQYWTMILVESWKKSWDKWGMLGIILPAFVSLSFAVITNWGKSISQILGENWILYGLLFIGFYILTVGLFVFIEPVTVFNKQRKQIQNLEERLETKKANIEIGEYCFPSYGQATKVGISIENKDDNNLLPKIKIVGEITRTKRYYTDVDIDPIRLDNNNRVIDFVEKIDFKGFGNISIAEIQGDHIVLCLEKKLLLASVKDVLEGDYYDWDFNFEMYGSINGEKFDNGLYSASIETKRTAQEVYLQIGKIKSLKA